MITWAAIRLFLAGVPRQVWYAIAALLLVWGAYSWAYHRGAESVRQDWDAERARNAIIVKQAADAARERERQQAASFKAIADSLKQENEHAKQNADRLVADLRAGNVRLRNRFTCPRTVSSAAGSATGSDEAGQGGFTVEDASVAIRIAADGDAAIRQLTACQAILSAERK